MQILPDRKGKPKLNIKLLNLVGSWPINFRKTGRKLVPRPWEQWMSYMDSLLRTDRFPFCKSSNQRWLSARSARDVVTDFCRLVAFCLFEARTPEVFFLHRTSFIQIHGDKCASVHTTSNLGLQPLIYTNTSSPKYSDDISFWSNNVSSLSPRLLLLQRKKIHLDLPLRKKGFITQGVHSAHFFASQGCSTVVP
jgi:hypothetical protein